MAPEHMQHGSALVYSVHCAKVSGVSLRAAWAATTNSACWVGSPSGGMELLPAVATTSPLASATSAAKGCRPCKRDSWESAIDSRSSSRSRADRFAAAVEGGDVDSESVSIKLDSQAFKRADRTANG